MIYRITNFKYKDVININNGNKLGFVIDFEIDITTSKVNSIIVCNKNKLFNFTSANDIVIKWQDIVIIGTDSILVKYNPPPKLKTTKSFWETLIH
jgi:YlmC/YmxH family sporulation protein